MTSHCQRHQCLTLLHDAHLHRVHDLFADADGTDDDHRVALVQHALCDEGLQGRFDGSFRIRVVEGSDHRRDAPIQGQRIRDAPVFTDGIDRGVARSHPTGVAGHVAPDGENDDGVGLQFVGHDHGALDHFLARGGQFRVFVKIRAAAAFDALRNALEDFDAFHRIFSDGRFAAEHDRVGLLENGVGHVGDLGARGHGTFDHAFEHVGGDDDRPTDAQTDLHNLALNDGQFLVGNLHAQVAASHHDGIGFGDNFDEILDGLLVLDLADDERTMLPAFDDRFQLLNVLGFANKRERDVINAQLQANLDIGKVLGGERGQADFDARQVDMAPAAERAFGEDFAFDLIALLGENFHLDRPVVEQHDVVDVDVLDEILVVDIHGMQFFAAFATHRQSEFLAGLEVQLCRQIAGANGRALRIHHDADGPVSFPRSGADVMDDAIHPFVRRVRHVQPEDVHTGVDELADHFGRVRRGAERGDDFGLSHAFDLLAPSVRKRA